MPITMNKGNKCITAATLYNSHVAIDGVPPQIFALDPEDLSSLISQEEATVWARVVPWGESSFRLEKPQSLYLNAYNCNLPGPVKNTMLRYPTPDDSYVDESGQIIPYEEHSATTSSHSQACFTLKSLQAKTLGFLSKCIDGKDTEGRTQKCGYHRTAVVTFCFGTFYNIIKNSSTLTLEQVNMAITALQSFIDSITSESGLILSTRYGMSRKESVQFLSLLRDYRTLTQTYKDDFSIKYEREAALRSSEAISNSLATCLLELQKELASFMYSTEIDESFNINLAGLERIIRASLPERKQDLKKLDITSLSVTEINNVLSGIFQSSDPTNTIITSLLTPERTFESAARQSGLDAVTWAKNKFAAITGQTKKAKQTTEDIDFSKESKKRFIHFYTLFCDHRRTAIIDHFIRQAIAVEDGKKPNSAIFKNIRAKIDTLCDNQAQNLSMTILTHALSDPASPFRDHNIKEIGICNTLLKNLAKYLTYISVLKLIADHIQQAILGIGFLVGVFMPKHICTLLDLINNEVQNTAELIMELKSRTTALLTLNLTTIAPLLEKDAFFRWYCSLTKETNLQQELLSISNATETLKHALSLSSVHERMKETKDSIKILGAACTCFTDVDDLAPVNVSFISSVINKIEHLMLFESKQEKDKEALQTLLFYEQNDTQTNYTAYQNHMRRLHQEMKKKQETAGEKIIGTVNILLKYKAISFTEDLLDEDRKPIDPYQLLENAVTSPAEEEFIDNAYNLGRTIGLTDPIIKLIINECLEEKPFSTTIVPLPGTGKIALSGLGPSIEELAEGPPEEETVDDSAAMRH